MEPEPFHQQTGIHELADLAETKSLIYSGYS